MDTTGSFQLPLNGGKIQESVLVRLVINALLGVKSSLDEIERLSTSFHSSPADRSFLKIPSLWQKSSSTYALGEILKSLGHSGLVYFLLRKFVDCSLGADLSTERENNINEQAGECPELANDAHPNELDNCSSHGLVYQAFSVAVGKILDGYLCALNTLFSSVKLRRSSSTEGKAELSDEVGSLASILDSGVSLLEVYLHTKELRTHIEALGHICFAFLIPSADDISADISLEFCNFPTGADLLTYLYIQLRDADPVHSELLKFIFVRSFEPYYGFIKSWIYKATVDDPYKEFIVQSASDSDLLYQGRFGSANGLSLSLIEEQGVSVPLFLKHICNPLLRAGQQLQVLIKLLDMCNCVTIGDQVHSAILSNLGDILPYWNESTSEHVSCQFPLSFDKRSIEAMLIRREALYRTLQEKLMDLFPQLSTRCSQLCSIVPQFYPVSLDDSLLFVSTDLDKVASNLAAASEDEGISNADDCFSNENEESNSSECSLTSFEDQVEYEEPVEVYNTLIASKLGENISPGTPFLASSAGLGVPPLSGRQLYSEFSFDSLQRMNPINCLPCHKKLEFPQFSTPYFQLRKSKYCGLSEVPDLDNFFCKCWPLGGLLENPFSLRQLNCPTDFQISDCCCKLTDNNLELEVMDISNSVRAPFFGYFDVEMGAKNMCSVYENRRTSFLANDQVWTLSNEYNLLSLNPMMTRNIGYQMDVSSGETYKMNVRRSSIPYFDFSTVEDPCETYGEKLSVHYNVEIQPHLRGSGVSPVGVNPCEQHPHLDGTLIHPLDKLVFDVSNSSRDSIKEFQGDDLSSSVSGGSKMESLLSNFRKDVNYCPKDLDFTGGYGHNSMPSFEIPLDVVVDKCMLQEILLQYKYVSNFTIKLLEYGFDLHGHLLALRHYHFMESADWADSFINSLWNHKWFIAEASQKLSEMQGFLDLALQRSSCESNRYKERLYVYVKDQGTSLSNFVNGIHTFDFIGLGYQVDWPISIVLTKDSLKIYAEIFSFLTRIKLAVFSLTDIWRLLKGLKTHNPGLDRQEMMLLNIIVKTRQQINHFVSTLQQYVQSQLSHVSWCMFSFSLCHQVRDMLDLESVHKAYLDDALLICFLSVDMESAACFMDNILQCALDFQMCFTEGGQNVVSCREGRLAMLAKANLTRVLKIKSNFEENLKQLYLCYLTSPKNRKFGLSCFWELLDYNEYFSNIINRRSGSKSSKS